MKEQLEQTEKESNWKPLPFWREIFLKREELPEYYNAKRKYLHDQGKSVRGMGWRKKIHPILLKLMELDRRLINHQTITVIKDEHIETDKPVIFAMTHVGMFDYQIVSEAIKAHQIVFAADPEAMYRTFDGALFALNGVVYCDTEDKTDRKVSFETAIETLEKGNNLYIAPEGVWNLTPNLLMLPLFPGIIKMAKKTGCDIIPIAVEQYGKDFYINIGKNFKVLPIAFDDENEEKAYIEQKKEDLREVMATLKWEIIEQMPAQERASLGDYAKKHREFVDTRLYEWFNKKENKPYYSEELVEHRTYKPKNIVFAKDAFGFLRKVKLNKNNAFLFRKHDSLPEETNNYIEELRRSSRGR